MAHPALLSPRLVAYHAGTLADAQTCRTPASAYAREQRILKAYTRLLYSVDTDVEALLIACFGEPARQAFAVREAPRPPKPSRENQKAYAAALKRIISWEERLDHEIPELIKKLRWDEQAEVEALLAEGSIAGVVAHMIGLEHSLLGREEPNTAPDDLGHIKAAGMGRLSSQNYGKLHPTVLAQPEPEEEVPLISVAEHAVAEVTPITQVVTVTPATQPAAWPHDHCAVCPGPTLRNKSKQTKARKRLQFEPRR